MCSSAIQMEDISTDTDKISLTQGMLNEYKNIDVEKNRIWFPSFKR